MRDQYNREIYYARISITNKCNYKCTYCYRGSLKNIELSVLDYEKLFKALKIFGIKKIRITGGEPTTRKDLVDIIKLASENFGEINMTTNGHFIKKLAFELKRVGLSGVNISLDTLDEMMFEKITGVNGLRNVLEGIEEALRAGLKVKLNTVLIPSVKKEFFKLVDFAMEKEIPIRFIELMPFGNSNNNLRIREKEIFELLESYYGKLLPVKVTLGEGPAKYYRLKNIYVGFISAFSRNICSSCNKIRITSDGKLIPCLGKDIKCNIKKLLNDEENLRKKIEEMIFLKPIHHDFGEIRNKGLNELGG